MRPTLILTSLLLISGLALAAPADPDLQDRCVVLGAGSCTFVCSGDIGPPLLFAGFGLPGARHAITCGDVAFACASGPLLGPVGAPTGCSVDLTGAVRADVLGTCSASGPALVTCCGTLPGPA